MTTATEQQNQTTIELKIPGLSPRQREVCVLLIRGNNNKQIARVLDISPRTVEDYRSQVFQKASVNGIVGLFQKVLSQLDIVVS